MSITITRGDHNTAHESDFTGYVGVRRMHVDESLATVAGTELERAFRGSSWDAQRLGSIFGGQTQLSEAFSTSDFKLAAFKELDTEMLAQYEALPSVWRQYCDTTLVSDFRPKRLVSRAGTGFGLARVPEGTEYPAGGDTMGDAAAITVGKYGRRRSLTWEAWLNNEAIDEIEDIPASLAREAAETDTLVALSNLLKLTGDGIKAPWSASGVNTDFFKAANGNAPAALPLTAANLQSVIDGMATRKVNGRTVTAPSLMVIVPKSLEATMKAIVAVTETRRTVDGVEMIGPNPLAGVSYVVEPALDQLNQHAKAAGTWFVVPKPGSVRPALWVAGLRGHEQPDLRVKADQGNRIGGGAISFDEGSFEIDTIDWRARHVKGAQTADATFTYCSLGS